jgi:imidazolonepropionase-like amidohydrolase
MWAAPMLDGANDLNSHAAPTLVLPWLRTVDALNTHDEGFALAVAGGVTTSLILPGSANAVGGQAFVAKLRPTQERSPSSLLLEPPFGLDGIASEVDREGVPPRWRHMKFVALFYR